MEFTKNDDPLFQKGGVNEISDDESKYGWKAWVNNGRWMSPPSSEENIRSRVNCTRSISR